jgi:hypothetical protein
VLLDNDQLEQHFDKIIKEYEGDVFVLEAAIGAFVVGRLVGWRVLLLAHSLRTFNKYQKLLKLDFKEYMPERGKYAEKSNALRVADKVGNYWKVVSGHVPGRTREVESLAEPQRS